MITLSVHWIVLILLIFIGAYIFWVFKHDGDAMSLHNGFGCVVFIIFVLVALTYGGIFIW